MTEEREQELREDAETGRRYKIAMEVWRDFLDNRREELMRTLEEKYCEDWVLHDITNELRVMKLFRDVSYRNIQRGEIAEEELAHGE
ncbi:MAG: hypothetical protein IJG51_11875 [Synergistaceae bacterium]|nr:hypothetical protein [Synergistaceae bacterium]MBQ6665893.1 hypothetical protein [Synergistaceae bacterium]